MCFEVSISILSKQTIVLLLVGSRLFSQTNLKSFKLASFSPWNILATDTRLQLVGRSRRLCQRAYDCLVICNDDTRRAQGESTRPHLSLIRWPVTLKACESGRQRNKLTLCSCCPPWQRVKERRKKKMCAALQVCALTGCVSGAGLQTQAA